MLCSRVLAAALAATVVLSPASGWAQPEDSSGVLSDEAETGHATGEAGDPSVEGDAEVATDDPGDRDASVTHTHTDTDTNADADTPDEEPAAPLTRPPRRAVPDYDGRPPSPPTVGQQLMWIPRVLLRPVYFVTEYLIRYPLGRLVSTAEEQGVPTRLIDAFLFGENDQILLAPTISLDFGLRAAVGLMFRYSDLLAEGHSVSAGAAFGGIDYISGNLGTSYSPEDAAWSVGLRLSAIRRADGLFFGIGREANDNARARFNFVAYDVGATYDQSFFRQSSLRVAAGYRVRRYGDDVGGSTSIEDVFARDLIAALPVGYQEGYEALWASVDLTIDTRPDRPAPGHGVRLHLNTGIAMDPGDDNAWITYGGTFGAYVDLSGVQHVLSASVSVAFAEGLKGDVPFAELPVLSGNGPMRGFVSTQLTGESAIAFNVQYTWPIWVFVDAKIHAALGNVFGEHLAGFEPSDLRLSFGVGLAAVTRRQHLFEILVGFGTDTLANGPDVEAVRILFGVTREF